ncbi:MAG TPA: DUF4215 domain-containing protein [Candidatus Acidoferrales bacterium]|nr:DUF4215 domain-containing protein [Candidatus Acidoferrales bacterium]
MLVRSFATAVGIVAFVAGNAWAYNCGGQTWQSVAVNPTSPIAGASTSYTIQATVPSLAGCNTTTSTEIDVTLPADTTVSPAATGSVNGTPITTFVNRAGTAISFLSPVSVGTNQLVDILVNGITNPTTPGSKTLTIAAAHTASGGPIGQTSSAPYTIVVPTSTPTATRTATDSPTSTPTSTQSEAATNTPVVFTSTSTPSVTPALGPCASSAANPCLPGGGAKKSDCTLEWLVASPIAVAGSGATGPVACYEGDRRCDVDPDLSNGMCSFRVQLCANNDDPRLPTCAADQLKVFEVKSPPPARSKDPADIANLLALEAAAGIDGFGVTIARGQVALYQGHSLSSHGVCSNVIPLQVPLRNHAKTPPTLDRKRIRVLATNSKGSRDSDTLKLECRPSTCGDGVLQADHETCDDGNRLSGDGCDQGCQREPNTPTPTPRTTPLSPTPTASETATSGPAPTDTGTPTAAETPTTSATFTPGSVGTATASPTPSETIAVVETPSATASETSIVVGTATATATATATQTATPVCGNGVLQDGETCTSCAADCVVRSCTATTPVRSVEVDFTAPVGQSVTGITVLVGYRSGTISLPGSGSASSVGARVKNKPSNVIAAVNDLDYALRVVLSRSTEIPQGRLFTVDFDSCQGATTPTASSFGCHVEGCANTFGNVSGCSCSVTPLF